MKKIILEKKFISLKLLTIALISCLAFANANASNLAILDLEKIIKESKAMRDIQNKVNKRQDEYQKEVTKKQNDLEHEQNKNDKANTINKDINADVDNKIIKKRIFNPNKEDDTNLMITKEILIDMINRIEYNYENNTYLKKYIKARIEELIETNNLLDEDL